MNPSQSGPSNPNWKGGRVIDPRGYVLIRVGADHPLADVRGYAYEHRIVAEQTSGRPLREGEEVHHDDELKGNNNPDNLIVASSSAEHRVFHRRAGSGLRLPGEDNPAVSCFCGCGQNFPKFDYDGRPRKYVSGHNPQPAATQEKILAILEGGPRSVRELASGSSLSAIKAALTRLRQKGLTWPIRHGVWDLQRVDGIEHNGFPKVSA
jgi:hypothetical protein